MTKLIEPSDPQTPDNHSISLLEIMSDQQLRDEVMTIFLADHETTANASTSTFYLLSQNTKIEAELHEELDDVIDSMESSVVQLTFKGYRIQKRNLENQCDYAHQFG